MFRKLTFAFSMVFACLLVLDIYPPLRGGGGWRWAYQLTENPSQALMFIIILALYVLGVYGFRHQSALLRVGWAVLGGMMISYSALSLQGDALELLFIRTVSPVQVGASTVAVRYLSDDVLSNWTDFMRQAEQLDLIHFTTSPPGQPLIHSMLAGITENLPIAEPISYQLRPFQCANVDVMSYSRGELVSVGLVGLLMPLWASLGSIPVFFAIKRLSKSVDVASRGASWMALLPTIILFVPTWNVFYPTLIAGSFALLLYGLAIDPDERLSPLWLIGGGVVMSCATFLNFAVLPSLLLFGLVTLGLTGLRRGILTGIWFGLGLSVCWVVYGLISGLTPLDLWAVTQEHHKTLVADRDYWAWLILHPYDTALFMGWGLVALFLLAVWRALKAYQSSKSLTSVQVVVLSMVIMMILLNITGIVQGENGRILSYYAPLMVISIAGVLLAHDHRWEIPLLAGQAVLVGAMALALAPVPLDLNPPPAMPFEDIAQLDGIDMIPSGQTFDGGERRGEAVLEAYRYVADVGSQVIILETLWRGIERFERPYWFEVTATAENSIDGEIVTEPQRWHAQHGHYLPTCWRDEDMIRDIQTLHMPTISEPVVWDLTLGWFDVRTGESLGDRAMIEGINYP